MIYEALPGVVIARDTNFMSQKRRAVIKGVPSRGGIIYLFFADAAKLHICALNRGLKATRISTI